MLFFFFLFANSIVSLRASKLITMHYVFMSVCKRCLKSVVGFTVQLIFLMEFFISIIQDITNLPHTTCATIHMVAIFQIHKHTYKHLATNIYTYIHTKCEHIFLLSTVIFFIGSLLFYCCRLQCGILITFFAFNDGGNMHFAYPWLVSNYI